MSSVNGNFAYIYDHDEPLKEGHWYWLEIQQVVEDGKVKRFLIKIFANGSYHSTTTKSN